MKSTRLKILALGATIAALFVLGGATAQAASCSVPTGSYPTIQSAVNDSSCDTINVAAGTYAENITIARPLTLLGAKAGVSPTGTGRVGPESQLVSAHPGDTSVVVTIDASNVTVNGFEIADAYASISTLPSGAPPALFTNLTFSYNWIHSNQIWRGIQLNYNYSSNFDTVVIDHNLITASANASGQGYTSLIGMSGAATYSNITISNNELSNPGNAWLFNGGNPAAYLINTMSITDNVVDAGEANVGNIKPGTVTGNIFRFDFNQIGIDTGTISGNSFTDGAVLYLWGTSFGFTRPSRDLTISHNAFGAGSEFWITSPAIDIQSLQLVINSFVQPTGTKSCSPRSGYLIYGPTPPSADTLDATYNWWGVDTGPGDAFGCDLLATSAPWITCYTDDPAYSGKPGFWPLFCPQGQKIQVRDQLVALRGTITNKDDRSKLLDAINHLNKSLDADNWIDESHPKPGAKGETVFNEEKPVVNDLKQLRDHNHSGVLILPATMQGYIDQLVGDDRALAVTAINEAMARPGANAGKIATAQSELGKGDVEAGKDHPDKAIDHYKNAWKNAVAA